MRVADPRWLIIAAALAACAAPRDQPLAIDALGGAGGGAADGGRAADRERDAAAGGGGAGGPADGASVTSNARDGGASQAADGAVCPPAAVSCPAMGCQLRRVVVDGSCGGRCEPAGLETACKAGDGCCPSGCTFQDDGDCERPNQMFVTSTTYTGNLGGLAGADAKCGERAKAAGLQGPFIALLSTSKVAAFTRLGDSRGWVRTDGLPFADTVAALGEGRIFYPPLVDEAGRAQPVEGDGSVFTATFPDGAADTRHCEDWTSNAAMVTGGFYVGTRKIWLSQWGGTCASPAHLYCFGTGRHAEVRPPPPPAARRLAFFLARFASGGGIADADARCATAAQGAGLAGEFRALMATSTSSAVSRFDLTGPPWFRPDGVPIVRAAADLAAGKLLTSIALAADGKVADWTGVWTGAGDPSAAGSSTCDDWRSTSATAKGIGGDNGVVSKDWFGYLGDARMATSDAPCNLGTFGVYCLAR